MSIKSKSPTWQSADGRIKLYHADCRDLLPMKCDAVVADPPYGVNVAEWDMIIPPQAVLDSLLKSAPVCVWFGASRPDCMKTVLYMKPCPTRTYIWNNIFTLTNSDGAFWQWQPFYVWGHLSGMKSDVVSMASNYRSDQSKPLHPCQKPIPLMNKIVLSACKESGIVLDPFMGSGTTGIACIRTGRRFVGIEVSPVYYETAKARIIQELKQQRLNL